jgi:hypothetical protein
MQAAKDQIPKDWVTARNHLLAMTALAMALGGGLVLVDPGLGSAVAVPLAWLVGQSTGAKFARLLGRQTRWDEALQLAALAAGLHVGVFLIGLALSMLGNIGNILPIRWGNLGLILTLTAVIGFAMTLGGLKLGATLALRRLSRRG